jgi:hypothetical protein
MKREDIGAHTIVEVKLTPFGVHVLAEYLKAESPPDRVTNGDRDIRPPFQRSVEMPIWELLKVFGPHTVSSARLPFEDLSFGRQESKEERTHRDAERSRSQALDDLRDLAKAVGVGNAFMAPEIIAMVARQFAANVPPRVPNSAGFWWLGDEVVKVRREQDGELTARINNHRRTVLDDQPWRGPAIADARVRKVENDEQDIPF